MATPSGNGGFVSLVVYRLLLFCYRRRRLEGGAHNDVDAMADTLREVLVRNLEELQQIDPETRLKQRYAKYRRFGEFIEG